MAQSKGFSSGKAYVFYTENARREGEESAKAELRKKELKRIRQEAKEEAMLGRYGKYGKVQKKIQKGFESVRKGAGIYNDMMSELHSLGSGSDSFYPQNNSKQAYASGYGIYKPKKKRSKKSKTKRKSRPKRSTNFWDQYM